MDLSAYFYYSIPLLFSLWNVSKLLLLLVLVLVLVMGLFTLHYVFMFHVSYSYYVGVELCFVVSYYITLLTVSFLFTGDFSLAES